MESINCLKRALGESGGVLQCYNVGRWVFVAFLDVFSWIFGGLDLLISETHLQKKQTKNLKPHCSTSFWPCKRSQQQLGPQHPVSLWVPCLLPPRNRPRGKASRHKQGLLLEGSFWRPEVLKLKPGEGPFTSKKRPLKTLVAKWIFEDV